MGFPHFKSMFRVKGNSNSAMGVGPGRRDGGDRRDAFGRGPGADRGPVGPVGSGDGGMMRSQWVTGWWWMVAMNLAFSQKYWVVIIIP